MTDPLTIPLFKPRRGGSYLFEREQAELHAEQQFVKHPGVDVLRFDVQYSTGVQYEEFVNHDRRAREHFEDMLHDWANDTQKQAEKDARKFRNEREGWGASDDK